MSCNLTRGIHQYPLFVTCPTYFQAFLHEIIKINLVFIKYLFSIRRGRTKTGSFVSFFSIIWQIISVILGAILQAKMRETLDIKTDFGFMSNERRTVGQWEQICKVKRDFDRNKIWSRNWFVLSTNGNQFDLTSDNRFRQR